MNKNILVFEYFVVYAGGERPVIMIDPQSAPTKQTVTYDPVFPESPNLKIINCDTNNIGNYPCKSIIIRNAPP